MTPRPENFLSARALGLKARYRNAMVTVLRRMERGSLVHVPLKKIYIFEADIGFNMGVGFRRDAYGCGTVGCIQGWAEYISGIDSTPYIAGVSKEAMNAYARLVCPPGWSDDRADKFTVEIVAKTLRRYLETGKTLYPKAVRFAPA